MVTTPSTMGLPKYFIASVLLTFAFCCAINTSTPVTSAWNTPCQLATGGNVRKALKECLHQRQVSSLLVLTLLLSDDVKCNPGPQPRNTCPCGMCERHVSWTVAGVACDDCSVWYHKTCIELCTADYDLLDRSSVKWICHKCDSINCNTFAFRSLSLNSTNFYSPLSDINGTGSVDSCCTSQLQSPKYKQSKSPTTG